MTGKARLTLAAFALGAVPCRATAAESRAGLERNAELRYWTTLNVPYPSMSR
jgi:hypothetical protein